MHSSFDRHELLVIRVIAAVYHVVIGILAEVEGMRLRSMNYEHSAADLVAVHQDRLIDERLTSDDVPSAVGIE